MYTSKDFPSKAALKRAVDAGEEISVYQPGGIWNQGPIVNQSVTLEGPHYPQPHRWYAKARVDENGFIIKGSIK